MVRKTKKHNRPNYNYSYHLKGVTINIVIRDGNKIIDKFLCNLEDKPLCKQVLSTIMHKYDIYTPDIETLNNNNDWLNLDNEFFK